MSSPIPRPQSLARMSELLLAAQREHPRLGARDGDAPPLRLPEPVLRWLAQLSLLYGVPFEYLVPDARLLPVESLRFFYLDRNWLDRLIDGAISIGTGSTLDNVFNEAFFEQIYAEVDLAQVNLRSELRRAAAPVPPTVGGTLTGFLFRSTVVTGWPGLEVRPVRDGEPLPILRLDPLGDGILLGIFDGVPDTVELIEPSEGLHFGVLTPPPVGSDGDFFVNLRGLGFGGHPAGQQIPDGDGFLRAVGGFRGGGARGVLAVRDLVAEVTRVLPEGALGPDGALTPAGFALQMVRGAGRQTYSSLGELAPCGDTPPKTVRGTTKETTE